MITSHIVEAGECLACGHILPFATYTPIEGRASVGICATCRRLAEPNRGPCSEERGCGCNVDPLGYMARAFPKEPSDA